MTRHFGVAAVSGAVIALLPLPTLAATLQTARVVADSAREAVEYGLPEVSRAFGLELRRPGPVTVIADFNENATGCRPVALGRAVGAMLRVEAWGLSRNAAFSHPVGYWSDRKHLANDHQRDSVRAAQRVGATHMLRGTVGEEGGDLSLRYELVDVADNVLIGEDDLTAPPQDVGRTLSRMLEASFRDLGATVSVEGAQRLQSLKGASDEGFAHLVQALEQECSGSSYSKAIEAAWKEQPGSPTIRALYALEVRGLHRADHALRLLDELARAGRKNPVVGMVAAYETIMASRRYQNEEGLSVLKRLAHEHPNEPAIIHAIGDALVSEELLCDMPEGEDGPVYVISGPIPHPAGYAAALALALRSIEVWPQDYRAWWNVGYALLRYGTAIRGSGYWSEVPESARRRLPSIKRVADQALTEARGLHPYQPGLYRLQIEADVGVRRDWMPTFLHGVRIAPQDPTLYRTAFNYALDQWGGNVVRRVRIYNLARRNNPSAEWPDKMYRSRAPDAEAFLVLNSEWMLLGVLLGLAIFAASILRRRTEMRTGPRQGS